jgi:23S rRNA pseudouridine1911/1915/1917 synthase
VTHIIVSQEDSGARLDAYLALHVPELSRSAAQRLILDGCVSVGGQAVRSSYKLSPGEDIEYTLPKAKPTDLLPEEISLDIVYEDEDILVINKPKGMVVHPAPGSPSGTLVNALIAHCKGLSAVGGVERPGIVHRLDKDTSGLIMVAKNDAAHHALQKQIQSRSAERQYLALVWGNPKFERAVVDAPIGRHPLDRKKMAVIETAMRHSREAVTELCVLERYDIMSLLCAKLQTGRTHQVRVHAAYAGHPVVGDPVYSGERRLNFGGKELMGRVNQLIDNLHGQALHAFSLSFNHPRTDERLSFTAPMPEDMQALVSFLRERCSSTCR